MMQRKNVLLCGVLLLLAVMLAFAGCSKKDDEGAESAACKSLDELSEKVGYSVNTPMYLPGKGYEQSYRALEDNVAQIVYQSDEQTITFTMAKQADMDLLGDLSDYPEEFESTCKGFVVPRAGKDGVAYAAQWSENDKTFALRFEVGITPELFDEVIKGV